MQRRLLILILLVGWVGQTTAQNVGIGTTVPHASAQLDVSSSAKGILIPRLSTAEREAIISPAKGLMVFDSVYRAFFYYNGAGWKSFKAATVLEDEDGDTKVQIEKLPDEDILRVDLGGTEQLVLRNGRLEFPNNDSNIYIGHLNGFTNTTGFRNTGLGNGALRQNQAGSFNTAVGFEANNLNNSGNYNTAVGYRTFHKNVFGSGNLSIGAEGLFNNIDGNNNIAIGNTPLYSNTTGNENIGIGFFALVANTQGNNNIAIGSSALRSSTGRSKLIAIGDSALLNNGSGFFFGTAAENNIAIGFSSLRSNTSGQSNIGIGPLTLLSNTQGSRNTAVGMEALKSGALNIDNTAIGHGSLISNNGDYNTATGSYSLYQNTIGTMNTATGYQALYLNTTGTNNTAIGYRAASTNLSGSGLTALGGNTSFGNTNLTNATAVGANTTVNISNALVLGNNAKVGIGTSSPNSSLSVQKLTGSLASATFSGTSGYSSFNEGAGENTYIRGGFNNSIVYINNTTAGQTNIGNPFGNNTTEIYGKMFGNNGLRAVNVIPLGVIDYEVSVDGDASASLNGSYQNVLGNLVVSAEYSYTSATGVGDAGIHGKFYLDQTITSQYTRVLAIGHPNFKCTGTVSNAIIYNLYSLMEEQFDNPTQKYLLAGMTVDDFPNLGRNRVYGTVIFYGVR